MRKYHWLAGSSLMAALMVGCNKADDAAPYAEAEHAESEHSHDAHHHEGPHGGHIVELTSDHSVHGEFVVDQEAKTATFHLLGEDLKTPVQGAGVIFHVSTPDGDSEVEFQPTGGGESASEFTVSLDDLPSSDIEALEGHFHVTVDGKDLSGDLSHDHDHDHDHDSDEEAAPAP